MTLHRPEGQPPSAPAQAREASIAAQLAHIEARLMSVERAVKEILVRVHAWSDRVTVVPLEGLLFAVPTEDWRLAAFLQHRGHPEPGLRGLLLPRLRPGTFFVDVGANIGLYTVAAGYAVGRSGRVLAVEPTPRTAEILRQNVRLNGLQETGVVTVAQVAVGEALGRARLATYIEDSGHNSLYPTGEGDEGVEVDVVPLDDLLPEGSQVDVVKIDVEGGELAVLRGMRQVATANPEIVVFAELAQEHLVRAGTSVEGLLAGAVELGWSYDVFETVSGASARADSEIPLTAFLYRTVANARGGGHAVTTRLPEAQTEVLKSPGPSSSLTSIRISCSSLCLKRVRSPRSAAEQLHCSLGHR
jgi:FkbM family methyltransferase